MVRESSNF
uniref:Uncharacterized protein n=1 Tax=Setaria italica TaxID=4555 RepID=A0A0Q3RL99_SETIT